MIAHLDKDMIKAGPRSVWRRLVSYGLFEGRPLTTRGRWINPLLFAHFRMVQGLPVLKRIDKPVYILGTGRSGTTVLGTLFHMHRQCGFLNEPKAMWHAVYPQEDIIGSYTRGPAFYRLDEAAATQAVKQRAHRLFAYYLAVSGAGRLVDKYPELIFRVHFLRAIFPDAKLVFLVRNGLDTLRSVAGWSGSHGTRVNIETHDWWGADKRKWKLLVDQVVAEDTLLSPVIDQVAKLRRQEDMAAVEWIVTMREGLDLLKNLPDAIHMVRYESLVEKPEETLGTLLEFCELPEDATMLRYARKVLSPPPEKQPVVLHPAVETPFRQTMRQMGYGGEF